MAVSIGTPAIDTNGRRDDRDAAGSAVRINLRPLANPLPLGLYSFGIGMLLLAAQSAGWAPLKESSQVGLVLATFVFPLEGTAAIFAFLARDTLAATVLGLFTTSWLTIGLALIIGPPGVASITLGFYLLGFAAAVLALAAVAVSGKPLIALVLTLSATRAILDGLYQVSSSTGLQRASAYVAAAIAAVAWYGGTAFVLEDVRQSELLPLLRRGQAKAAVDGSLGRPSAEGDERRRCPPAALSDLRQSLAAESPQPALRLAAASHAAVNTRRLRK